MVARTEHDRCARGLAAAVATHLVASTNGTADAMHAALLEYTDARKALEAA